MLFCKDCSSFKEETEFSLNRSTPTGFQFYCKKCISKRSSKDYQTHKKARRLSRNKYRRMRRKLDPLYDKPKTLDKEKRKIKYREYQSKRLKTDLFFKLRRQLRSRLSSALRQNSKVGSAVDLLGCSIEELKLHLENKFKDGMTWENHSKTGWHIDHIQPLSKFDLTDKEQLKIVCHYTNLQPLWAADNLRKKDKR